MQIVTKSNRTITLELMRKEGVAAQTQPQNHGKLIVHAEESLASKTNTEIVFRGLNLESKDTFSKSVSYILFDQFFRIYSRHKYNIVVVYAQDPFLVISKIVEHGNPIPVSKTEVLKNDPNPLWKPVSLSVQQVGSKVNQPERFLLSEFLSDQDDVSVSLLQSCRIAHW